MSHGRVRQLYACGVTAAPEVAESMLPRELLWGNLQSNTAVSSARATPISSVLK